MIELLIVIAILGILAVAVLAAINPIDRLTGRDTGTRSDAEQLLGAIDRFNAFQDICRVSTVYRCWANKLNDVD